MDSHSAKRRSVAYHFLWKKRTSTSHQLTVNPVRKSRDADTPARRLRLESVIEESIDDLTARALERLPRSQAIETVIKFNEMK
jgi:hypothetical protein